MNKLIACCGLNCETCEARIATINNDDTLREKVALEWSKLNNVTITKDMINCNGCMVEGIKTPFCDKLCPIRKCILSKGYRYCSDCESYLNCDKLKMITSNNNEALNRLKSNIKLVKLSIEYKDQLKEMMDEWTSYTKKESPAAIFKNDYNNFDYYLEHLEIKDDKGPYVPDSVYFALDPIRNIFCWSY